MAADYVFENLSTIYRPILGVTSNKRVTKQQDIVAMVVAYGQNYKQLYTLFVMLL
jgi:hypothetical protein